MNEQEFRVVTQIKSILMIIARLMIHKMWYSDAPHRPAAVARLSELAKDLENI